MLYNIETENKLFTVAYMVLNKGDLCDRIKLVNRIEIFKAFELKRKIKKAM